MTRSRRGWMGFGLILLLLVMMGSLIGLTSSFSKHSARTNKLAQRTRGIAEHVQQSPLSLQFLSDLPASPSQPDIRQTSAREMPCPKETRATADLKVKYRKGAEEPVAAYDLNFSATYVVANTEAKPLHLGMVFPFPKNAAVLSQVSFTVDGAEPENVHYSIEQIWWGGSLEVGQERKIKVSYRAEGVGGFSYAVPHAQRVHALDLRVTVHDAIQVDTPEFSLQPTERKDGKETSLVWNYKEMITNADVLVELPSRRSSLFSPRFESMAQEFNALAVAAPFLTIIFLLCFVGILRLESRRVPMEHKILLGIGFFLFYPLYIFAAAFLALSSAFVMALLLAGFLVLLQGVRILGRRTAAIYLLPLLLVFYGLLPHGLTSQRTVETGLMIVLGAVLLVALFMWRGKIGPSAPEPESVKEPTPEPEIQEIPLIQASSRAETPIPKLAPPFIELPAASQQEPISSKRYCAHCGCPVEAEFRFCPHCGNHSQATFHCPGCTLEYIPHNGLPAFCPACGKGLVPPPIVPESPSDQQRHLGTIPSDPNRQAH